MSTSLTPTVASGAMPERFANPLKQIGTLMQQPAVRRSLPMVLMIGLIAAAALAWMALSTPAQRTLFPNLSDSDKAAVTQALTAGGIGNHIDADTGAVTVNRDDYAKARMLLASQNLPKAAPGGYAILDNMPMGTSRAVEGERLRQARESELAQSIEEIDAVDSARVHLAMPEESVFVRDNASPSASVVLKLQPGRSLDDAQVSSIVNLVASSVPGMKADSVTIVDQSGNLKNSFVAYDDTSKTSVTFGGTAPGAQAVALHNVAAGAVAASSTDAVNGSQLYALEQQMNSSGLGLVMQNSSSRTITVGANTDGKLVDFTGTSGARKLTGVAGGSVDASSSDAVNGAQLYGTAQSTASAISSSLAPAVRAPRTWVAAMGLYPAASMVSRSSSPYLAESGFALMLPRRMR